MTDKKSDKLKAWLMKAIEESDKENGLEIIEDVKDKYEQKVYESKVKSHYARLLEVLAGDASALSLDNDRDRLQLVLTLIDENCLEQPED